MISKQSTKVNTTKVKALYRVRIIFSPKRLIHQIDATVTVSTSLLVWRIWVRTIAVSLSIFLLTVMFWFISFFLEHVSMIATSLTVLPLKNYSKKFPSLPGVWLLKTHLNLHYFQLTLFFFIVIVFSLSL